MPGAVQHVARGGLSLTFGNHPMFDPDVFAGMRIGPARDVACGVNSRDAGFEMGVHGDAAIEPQGQPVRPMRGAAETPTPTTIRSASSTRHS